MGYVVAIIVILAVIGIDFLLAAGALKICAWAFGFAFSWKLAIGAWIVLCILHSIAKSAKSNK